VRSPGSTGAAVAELTGAIASTRAIAEAAPTSLQGRRESPTVVRTDMLIQPRPAPPWLLKRGH
jgi:hypothetical protein